jgi:Lon protease-like protein
MDKIPLFPLNLVLFPGTHVPLRIFETRYIDLVSECLRTESGFGVSLIMEGSEIGGGAKCHQFGTYARIVDWSQLEDGLLGITAKAERRFRINEFSERENTLLEGLVEWVEEDLVPENAQKYKVLQDLLTRVLSHFEIEYADLESKLNDPLWLGYRLAEFLPLEPRLKQELLEMTDYSERLARLQELLKDTDIA